MDTELQVNEIAHSHNMLGRIVSYAYDKHVRNVKKNNIIKN